MYDDMECERGEHCTYPDCDCDPDYTKAGHLRELPELLNNITVRDMMTFYESDEYDYPWD
jgi:hypothetical protein